MQCVLMLMELDIIVKCDIFGLFCSLLDIWSIERER